MSTQLFPHPKDLMAGPAKSGERPAWIRPADDHSDIVQQTSALQICDNKQLAKSRNAGLSIFYPETALKAPSGRSPALRRFQRA